ncbi:fumarylacetoacetate hydrolase family protein [Aliiglaciecola sp.]|nr:fumarylacetoacetate hydrolase family protein [Aliiglaciecola sp.]
MQYAHVNADGLPISLPVGKVVCVGRNYVDHIQELNNDVPDEPLLFIKPATSLCDMHQSIHIPLDKGGCHNEVEVSVLIKDRLSTASVEKTQDAVWGVGIGLDLTLRQLQDNLKQRGLPWERAKAFDNSCPMSPFVPLSQFDDLTSLAFSLTVNGEKRQNGNTSCMIWNIASLLSEISQVFTLMPGDIVMTGTPKGVGPLNVGDELILTLAEKLAIHCQVEGQ